jgi:hypothetical protein
MHSSRSEISIVFDEPFWVAIFERFEYGYYSVAREIIGTSEPSGAEMKSFFESLNTSELRFTEPIKEETHVTPSKGYKYQVRKANKENKSGLSKNVFTKAQYLLKLQRHETKVANKADERMNTIVEKQAKFELRQHKKKEKQRGH